MDELLAKYMLNETTPAENEAIQRWIDESDSNRKHFEHFKLIWETSMELKVESRLDEDESWAKFKQMTSGASKHRLVPMYSKWLRIAAVWAVVLTGAVVAYQLFKPADKLLTTATSDQIRIDTLSDGSIITLNKNSALSYPPNFTGDVRQVSLIRGEAFFDIAHDKKHPFIINTNDIMVKVLGTSFNIKNTGTQTEVIVETGVVQVSRKKITVRLKPKDKVSVNRTDNSFKKGHSTDVLYNYYRTKVFMPDHTPLWRVAEVLNEVYHVNIVIADKRTAHMQLTTTFRDDSLDNILSIISKTFNLKVIRQGDKITIK